MRYSPLCLSTYLQSFSQLVFQSPSLSVTIISVAFFLLQSGYDVQTYLPQRFVTFISYNEYAMGRKLSMKGRVNTQLGTLNAQLGRFTAQLGIRNAQPNLGTLNGQLGTIRNSDSGRKPSSEVHKRWMRVINGGDVPYVRL